MPALPAPPVQVEVGPPIAVVGRLATHDPASPVADDAELSFSTLLRSVDDHFPLLLAALEEVEAAAGREERARGAFDLNLFAKSRFDIAGFYENDRVDLGVEQATPFYGSKWSAGYRIGRGDFDEFDEKAKTNDGGEFRLGFEVPLLQGVRLDPARVRLWKATVASRSVAPEVEFLRLEAQKEAASAYWRWIGDGARSEVASRLARLATERQGQLEEAVREGQLPPITLKDNRRLIVERQAALVDAERTLQDSAIALSLFLRDATGSPRVPTDAMRPKAFPDLPPPDSTLRADDLETALARRPEIRLLALRKEALELDRDLADNQLLPRVGLGAYTSQDIGGAVSRPDDKGPFAFGFGLTFSLPFQRRAARGSLREASAKIAQLDYELFLARDRVGARVGIAANDIQRLWERWSQARESRDLALDLEAAERFQVDEGESDLFRLNVRERQTASAATNVINAAEAYARARVEYETALGLPLAPSR